MAGTIVILGCGYIGTRLARAALERGRTVRVCSRSPARHEALKELGAEVRAFDASRIRQFMPAIDGTRGATVVYAVPPVSDIPAGEGLSRATEAALHFGARAFIYLSSAGLYGDIPEDTWVDEDTPVAHDDAAMSSYHMDESGVQSGSFAGLRTIILRLTAVYGPGRGVRSRLMSGDYKLLDGGKHWNSRIHVDDLVRVIFAAEERAPQGSLYLVGDDKPTTQKEYADWLCARLGLPPPPSVASYAPGARRTPHRGRRIRNDRMKRELDLTLSYPTYVEGELAIEAEERGEAPAPAAPEAPAEPRPPFVVNAATLPAEDWSYPGRAEKHGKEINLGDGVGLKRVGVCLVELPPGRRSSLPHAHSAEEELAYVLEGTPDLWIDGKLHRLAPGDVVGFAPGTGIAHTAINNSARTVRLLVVGERRPGEDKVTYPTDPERQAQVTPERSWTDAPRHELGGHDGKPGPGK
jgi:uncharacterized cupin superfamily protein/nucleoside-diphosphate-sugar epimerase